MSLWIGIDPGLCGAVAAIDESGLVSLQETPVVSVRHGKHNRKEYSEPGMATLLQAIMHSSPDDRRMLVVIENVHSMPKQGVASSFHFGVGFGIWRGIIAALRLPYERVEPVVWKRALHLSREKGKAVQKALRLYPRAELGHKFRGRMIYHDGLAEALLLAHYARATYGAPTPEKEPKSKSAVKSAR